METPCLIVIGLSGAGKSLSLQWLEENYAAERVRRFTNRTKRIDDNPLLVVHVDDVKAGPNDFLYHGWTNTAYCIRQDDIAAIRQRRLVPLIELGDPADALRCKQTFPPGSIACLWRRAEVQAMERILRERKMDQREVAERLATVKEDTMLLKSNSEFFDFVIANSGNVTDLCEQWTQIMKSFGMKSK